MAETSPLTAEEVSSVVLKKLNVDTITVSNFTLQSNGEWVGLCGDHAILEVTIEEDKKLTFFLKLYPTVEFVVKFIEGTGSFRKEIFVYDVFDKFEQGGNTTLQECVARCYFSKPNKCLVLDNLVEDGFRSPDKHKFFDYQTVKVVLEALAKLHASSLIYEEQMSKKLGNTYRLLDEYHAELEETYFNDKKDFPNEEGLKAAFTGVLNSIELFDELPEKLLSGKNFRDVLEQELVRVFDLVKPSKDFRNVICHGDLWATNLLLKSKDDKPIKCKLVDFQCARYAPPAQDVMNVIHLTTSRDFRRKWMYDLTGVYYNSLEKHVTLAGFDMKQVLKFEDFLSSCDRMKIFAVIQSAMYFPLILMRSEVVKRVFGDSESNKRALQEDRSLLVKEQMHRDEEYRRRVLDSLLDLKDHCDYL